MPYCLVIHVSTEYLWVVSLLHIVCVYVYLARFLFSVPNIFPNQFYTSGKGGENKLFIYIYI